MNASHETHAASLVSALSPKGEHGATALVVGSAARVRRAILDHVAARLGHASPKRLVVRLATREPGARLRDGLSGAVEEQLHRAHAPGALHDDRSDQVVAGLGAWLYRARSAGFEGLVLVIDDLEGWVDARGGAPVGDPLGAEVTALLAASRQRNVSVLAGVRASSASGAPALPREVVEAFDSAVLLGGAPTVTRDPTTLIAALSGRSFHLPGLQESLAGWLDLPPPAAGFESNDTVVVFSSPLAPPALPADPTPFSLEWARPDEPEAPANAAPAGEARVSPEDVVRWSSGLRAAIRLSEAVRAARGRAVDTPAAAERVFVESVERIPRSLAALSEGEASAGVEAPRVRRAARAVLARFDEDFARVLAALPEDGGGVLRVEALSGALARHAERVEARGTAFVVMRGLRYDLWGRFKKLLAQVAGLAASGEEGVAWSIPGDDDAPAAASLVDALRPRREHRGSTEVTCLNAYAAALAGGVTDAELARVEAALPAALRAVCGGFAGRTAVLIAGDAGVGEPASNARSAFAVLVPYGLFTFGARTP